MNMTSVDGFFILVIIVVIAFVSVTSVLDFVLNLLSLVLHLREHRLLLAVVVVITFTLHHLNKSKPPMI